jgi:hypothetical protein
MGTTFEIIAWKFEETPVKDAVDRFLINPLAETSLTHHRTYSKAQNA